MNTEKALGIVAGVMIVAVFAGIAAMIARKKGVGRGQYDERQQIARGKAFTAAYATLLVYLAFWLILRSMEAPFFMESLSVMLGGLLSIAVFVGHSIFHDAYFKASESPRAWIGILCAIGLVNLGIGMGQLLRGGTLAERLYDNINLFVGALFAVILACILVKRAIDRQSAED